jgi:hypothetical protein
MERSKHSFLQQNIAEDHNVSATAVAEYQSERNQSFEGVGTDLANDFYNQNLITGAYAVQGANGSVGLNSIVSYVGRLSYNYKQKYFLQDLLDVMEYLN